MTLCPIEARESRPARDLCETGGAMRTRWRLSAALGLALAGGAGGSLWACALDKSGLGPADASVGDDGPSVDSGSETQSGDAPSETMVPDAMADVVEELTLCQSLCTMEGGTCVGEAGNQCSISCASGGSCPSVVCPPGIPCLVDCTGSGSCSGGVNCADASSCNTVCGASNCGPIACGGSSCTVLCQGQGACTSTIDCTATNSCTIDCIGQGACVGAIHSTAQNTSVSCQQPDTCGQPITCTGTNCQVFCAGSGACASGECCDAGTCNPSAPTNLCP
jgi:hypothetical protein